MKIHILEKDGDPVGNYNPIYLNEGRADLSSLSDNECEFILASDVIDHIDIQSVHSFLVDARKKMRMGSSIVIGGTDIRLLSRAIINNQIEVPEANALIYSKKSCSDINSVISILNAVGLTITSTKMTGIHYEIESKREQAGN